MFGWFKKKADPLAPDRNAIVPRIKHLNFLKALQEMDIPLADLKIG